MKHYSLGQQRVLFSLALFILALIYYKFYYRPASPPEEVYKEVVIEVLGEVRNPGVYIFKAPPTLIEAVEKGGGLKDQGPFDHTSSAETLETGTQITISKEIQHPPLTKGGDGGITQNVIKIKLGRMEANKLLALCIPLDLNRVSVEDLCLIPGIGESLAREIVTYRVNRRRFRSTEELKNIKGIGEKKFDSIKNYFIVRP